MIQILVVEDHPEQLEMVATLLYFNGFDVLRATTGMAAMAVADLEQPDLILMDVKLPDMNGMQAGEIIHARAGLGMVPIIGITGLDLPLALALERGFVDLLYKPVPPVKLLQTIRRHLPPGLAS